MVDVAGLINQAIRYANAVSQLFKGFTLNKRFINLNILVVFLILIILVQTFFLQTSTTESKEAIVVMKTDTYSSNYEDILKKYKSDEFQKKSLNKRCNIYFDTLNLNKYDWKLDNFNTDGYDDNLYSFDSFVNYKKSENKDLKLDEKTLNELEKEYMEKNSVSSKVEKKIVEAISTLRVFDKCFIDTEASSSFSVSNFLSSGKEDEEGPNESAQDLCLDTETRIFPWLSNFLPIYTRWDGTVSVGMPDLRNVDATYSTTNNEKSKRASRKSCFLSSLKKNINGKGFVISASDGQVDELKRLALILRAVGNKLPIQIVHKGDLSNKAREELVDQFRRKIDLESLPTSYEDLELPADLEFPPQELWFVNVRQAIVPDFNKYFQKYANKLLAYLFNSFEDMIILDTDTVPFVKLEEILDYPEYVSNGAYFFQDRNLKGQNSENQINYFERLFPSKLDTYFFGIPQVTSKTTKNRFFGGRRNHFMESGVVAINRKKHFSGMLMALQLNFWGPTASKIHGDKELFWLGMSLSGDEDYVFNKYGAASIGELTKDENKRLLGSTSSELCSNHPGHIDYHGVTDRLIWINSGFTYCKNTAASAHDKGKPLYKDYTEESLHALYTGITKIRAAIVPPPQEVEAINDLGNPTRGWTDEHKYCWGYTWCAYDFIGDRSLPEQVGTLVEFSEKEVKWFDFVGDLWMKGAPKKATS